MLVIRMKRTLLALALAVPLAGMAQESPAPPMGPEGPQGRPGWQHRGGPDGPGMGWHRGMRGAGLGRRGMGRHMGRPVLGRLLQNPAMRERLGFTPEQAAKIQAQENTFAKTRIRNHADLRVKRMELDELVNAEKPDRAAIDKKLREIQEIQFSGEKGAIDHRLAMREMITAEQRQKMQEMYREFRMGPQRGPGGPGGPGRRPGGPPPPAAPQPPVDSGR